MYYIRNGLGKNWKWLGVLFAIFGMLAGFGIGNTVQSNSVADVMQSTFSIPPLASGVVITVLVALVLVGGIQRIGDVAGRLVPFMAFLYVVGGLVAILINIDQVPAAVGLIIERAVHRYLRPVGF